MGAVPSPSHIPPVQGLANAEEVAAPSRQSERELGVEEVGRKSPLTRLQMTKITYETAFLLICSSSCKLVHNLLFQHFQDLFK